MYRAHGPAARRDRFLTEHLCVSAGTRAFAFVIPREVRGTEALDDFLVTVDPIE